LLQVFILAENKFRIGWMQQRATRAHHFGRSNKMGGVFEARGRKKQRFGNDNAGASPAVQLFECY
jgi:hypothetical protein